MLLLLLSDQIFSVAARRDPEQVQVKTLKKMIGAVRGCCRETGQTGSVSGSECCTRRQVH